MPFGEARVARAMLARIFGDVPTGYHVVLFRLNPARSVSFQDIDRAAGDAAGESNVWVHVGLTKKVFHGGDRPEALEIDAISGMWADLDVAHPVHKKPGLPPDEEAALSVVKAMGLKPGLIIRSGHGLQAWWPFPEPWTFENAAERRRARILARAWAITLRERAKRLGFTVDMVSDISRVLRMAGSVNDKRHIEPSAMPMPVTILEQSGATVSEDDIVGVLLDGAWDQAERDIDQKKSSSDAVNYGDLILDPAAEPPWQKLDLLRELEPRADHAWRRKRTKRSEDWSASEWDQSLAAYAAQADWSRQEIANLLIASRRKHGDNLKTDRQDYYGMTIDKATAGREEQEAVREAVAEMSRAQDEDRPETERPDILATICKAVRVELTRVTRSRSEPPVFGIETPHGNGQLGNVESIVSNRKFRLKVAEITNRIPRKLKDDEWEPLAQALLQVAEIEDLGVETTLAGKAETLVSVYLGNHSRQLWTEMSEKAFGVLPIRQEPFVDERGATCIFLSGFKTWLAEHQHEQMTRTEISTMLRAWGANVASMHFLVNGKRTTRSVWRLPEAASKGVDG